ncbi:hypothetical protein ACFW5S_25440 [Streptomyces olivaceus]|uniref:hypothetical protein n=1 Tax=Streptomyces olivaceus TaxID=47716 RepID=UPI0033A693B7
MSLGDDHQSSGGYGGTGQTRLRLPEPEGGPRRGGRSSSRSLITVVGVVVLLIAAIAFANRGGDGSASAKGAAGNQPDTSSTAPTGTRPVQSGFAHDEQGAQSAAANYAEALGSDGMFDKGKRDAILQAVVVPDRVADFQATMDKAYTPAFNKNVGLNEDGSTPKGYTFVSRTSPIGSKVTERSADGITVEVWCNGLLGLAGQNSTSPVTSTWFTITVRLQWAGDDWKIVTHSQKDGPAPIPGDDKASTADEMAKAVQEYGGFTYAR